MLPDLLSVFAMPLVRAGVAVGGAPALGPRLGVENSLSGGVALRIMPLGASITWGAQSTDGNGYRKTLRTRLVTGGNPVNMVGTLQHGDMKDNDNEGWYGYVIDQIHGKANASVPKYLPNVVLVNAGTNDCLQDLDVPHAADRMRRLLLHLYDMSPRATVVLSSLLVNGNATAERYVETVNRQFRALASDLRAAGRRLVFADMHGPDGPQKGELVDGTHPDDAGYRKMAAIWYRALVDASAAGFLQKPQPVQGLPDNGGNDT